MESLKYSSSCKDVRNPIKLSSGCSQERYMMRQKYLRSYPLVRREDKDEKIGNAVKRVKKWLKEMKRKNDGRENERKATGPATSSHIQASVSLLAEVDVFLLPTFRPA
ncbi:hypothetical protein GOBAR_DD12520 [Gossypium barbadense]|uniref:Uncharacterized protein n=1 Tax=Gossypium tomentosum TaxID=34277 RepID=A0A5D2J473_GOSTO|nr:hypothetical protein GOBAR_DD12520 [Gossypium barbadense]TYH49049.1 hypothetical protein ES332_D10G110200v1 [Gossypium tomentosum]